jgi:hypothetical protein
MVVSLVSKPGAALGRQATARFGSFSIRTRPQVTFAAGNSMNNIALISAWEL